MPLIHVNQFVTETLPAIVGRHKGLHALFASYNQVGDYPDGESHPRQGLHIVVQNGNLAYSAFTISAITSPHMGVAKIGSMAMNMEADRSQALLERKLEAVVDELPDGESLLAVVYAGLTAFERVIEYVIRLRMRFPEATIVVLTCDCDMGSKLPQLDACLEDGVINHAIYTHWCGGEPEMGQMLDMVIANWPGVTH